MLYIENGNLVFFGDVLHFLEQYNRLNEYQIHYNGNLPEEAQKYVSDSFNVKEWCPLTVERLR